jgi:hypothetical protein
MPRYIRNTVILAKIETTAGTDAVPTGAANACLISNASINPLNASNVPRDLLRGYFGGSEQLVGTAYVEASFDVELAGSGTAGTAPAWGELLKACAFSETISAGNRVDYTPISTTLKTATIYYYDDGVLHKLLGAMGDFSINLGIGERPVFSFRFIGIDGGVTAAANATPTLTAWKTPLAVTDPNTGDVTFGCTYATGSLTGGTTYPSRGLQVAMGNTVNHVPLLGGETVDLTNRDASGSLELDLTAAQEATFHTSVKASTTQSIGMVHGTVAGNIIVMHAPAVQLINPKKSEITGRRLIGYDMRILPSTGNDDLRIVAK